MKQDVKYKYITGNDEMHIYYLEDLIKKDDQTN